MPTTASSSASPQPHHAIVTQGDGALIWAIQAPLPELGPHEVRLRVHATAVNRADLMQRRGLYPPPPGASDVLGLEVSGEVEARGSEVPDEIFLGMRACALLTGGGYAEVVHIDHRLLLPIPKNLSMVEAACLPEVFATAYLNLFMEGELAREECALIHAAASGVGTAAIQLCRAMGVRCIATASASKLPALLELGATHALDRRDPDLFNAIQALAPQGVDVILDPVGGSYLESNLNVLAVGGRLVVIGLMGGRSATLPLGRLLVKRQRIIGSVLRSRSIEQKAKIIAKLQQEVWPLLDSGAVRPILSATFSITEAEQAHALMESDTTTGKIALVVSAS